MYGTVKVNEIIALLDAKLGTDWKLGTTPDVVAALAGADLSVGTVAATDGAPGDQTESTVVVGQKDSSVASKATLDIETEEEVAVVGSYTASHKLAVWINGVEYEIQLQAVT